MKDTSIITTGIASSVLIVVGFVLILWAVQQRIDPAIDQWAADEEKAYEQFLESCLQEQKLYQCQAMWKSTAWYR